MVILLLFLSGIGITGGYYSLSADAFIVTDTSRLTQSFADYIKNATDVSQAGLAAQVLIGIKQDGALLDNNLFAQTIVGTPYEKLFVDLLYGRLQDVSTFNPTANGTAANSWLVGTTGNDNLNGGSGNDALFGGVGNDRLWKAVNDRSWRVAA